MHTTERRAPSKIKMSCDVHNIPERLELGLEVTIQVDIKESVLKHKGPPLCAFIQSLEGPRESLVIYYGKEDGSGSGQVSPLPRDYTWRIGEWDDKIILLTGRQKLALFWEMILEG